MNKKTARLFAKNNGLTLEEINTCIVRVNTGAKWLDSVKPDWLDSMAIDKLTMCHTDWCICGQVFGGYRHAAAFFGIEDIWSDEGDKLAVSHGFQQNDDSPFELLDPLWVELLTRRSRSKNPEFIFLKELKP